MADSSKRKVYVIRVETWWGEEGERGAPRVWTFPERAQAEAYQKQLTQTCRGNPFRRDLALSTSLEDEELRDVIGALGLESPRSSETWSAWWQRNILPRDPESAIDAATLARIWEVLDLANPFPLSEEEIDEPTPSVAPRGKAFVVQRYHWWFSDEWYYVLDDEPLKAYRNREKAEASWRELEWRAREEYRNPARMAERIEDLSSLTWDELLDGIRRLGLRPPVRRGELTDLVLHAADTWWDELRLEQRNVYHQVWDLFDRIRFYEVVCIDLDSESGLR